MVDWSQPGPALTWQWVVPGQGGVHLRQQPRVGPPPDHRPTHPNTSFVPPSPPPPSVLTALWPPLFLQPSNISGLFAFRSWSLLGLLWHLPWDPMAKLLLGDIVRGRPGGLGGRGATFSMHVAYCTVQRSKDLAMGNRRQKPGCPLAH